MPATAVVPGTCCCLPATEPPVTVSCCPDDPIPRTLNYAVDAGGTSCANVSANVTTGTVVYQAAGPFAGEWVSPVVTLTGCTDSAGGGPIPDLDVVVVMRDFVDGLTGLHFCAALVVPYPASQGGCFCTTAGPTGGTTEVVSAACSPFDVTTIDHVTISAFCPGGTNHYCGNSTLGVLSAIKIRVYA